MNGMLFAAGLGTRLAPLTNDRPKALVNVNGTPLLKYAIDNMHRAGVTTLIVNVHHFAQMIYDYLNDNASTWEGMTIKVSNESDQLLETGGGIVKALPLYNNDKPIIIGNADVLSNIDLASMYNHHTSNNNDVTLLMSTRTSTRGLLFDADNRFMGRVNKAKGEQQIARNAPLCNSWAFNGFHITNQDVVKAMPQEGAFGIIDGYLAVAERFNIKAYMPEDPYYWYDVGTADKLIAAEIGIDKYRRETACHTLTNLSPLTIKKEDTL